MGIATVATLPPRPLIDDDVYDAEVVKVTETNSKFEPPKPQYEIEFRLIDPEGDFDGATVRYWVNRILAFDDQGDEADILPKESKVYAAVRAILPEVDLELGDTVDVTSDLVGRKARLSIGHKASKETGKVYNFVTGVLPYKKTKKALAS